MMSTIKPFLFKIGGKAVGWRAVVNGKVAELGDGNITEEEAQKKLETLLKVPAEGPTAGEIGEKVGAKLNLVTPSSDAPKPDKSEEKPSPGTLRKQGLAELSPQLVKKFREMFAASLADANYSADKVLFSFFGYTVSDIAETDKDLLKVGWELACQQYFVDGVPPPWLIILFANIQIGLKLGATAKAKDSLPNVSTKPTGNSNADA